MIDMFHTRNINILFIIISLLFFAGCSIPITNEAGTTYHLIIGLGIVTTNHNINTAATVTRSKTLGVSVSNQPGLLFGMGYSSSKTVSIKEGAENVLVEIEDNAMGDLSVTVGNMTINHGEIENEIY